MIPLVLFTWTTLCVTDIMKEYRKLDDTIVMRLNRANASMRDRDRIHGLDANRTLQDETCEYIWRELVGKSSKLYINDSRD